MPGPKATSTTATVLWERPLQAAARATHSLTCGVPDRESNEVKYLREATELIEEWQFRLQGGQRVSAPASDHERK